MLKYWRRFFRKTEGATAIEYAIVLPVLLWLIMGILEFSMIMYASAVLEGATNFAARMSKTGYTNGTGGNGADALPSAGICPIPDGQSSQTSAQYILCILQSRVAGLLNPNQIEVNAMSVGGYDNITTMPVFKPCTSDPTIIGPPQCSSLISAGSSGQTVVYTARYAWPIYTPFLQNVIGTNGFIILSSSALVKNEPYGNE